MYSKVILILVDGMRPDAVLQCGNPFVNEFMEKSRTNLHAKTVMPSVTLPCHMSLFHSVAPGRHGILTNTYVPQVRPVPGLFEVLCQAGKSCAAFYNWEELRDLSRPGNIQHSLFRRPDKHNGGESDRYLTLEAVRYIQAEKPDFVFLYLGNTDGAGHEWGWMTEKYMEAVKNAWACIQRIFEDCSKEYAVIVTADHGGHDQMHGMDMPEDMMIPLFIHGVQSSVQEDENIMDIAPTIAEIMGVTADPHWEGRSLI